MAGSPVVQFAGPSYHLADRNAAVQASINCYPSRLEGKTWMLRGTPGKVLISSLPGPVRGTHVALGRLFVAAGTRLYEMLANETFVERGTFGSSVGFVGMDNNSTQLAIVDGAGLYILALASRSSR